MLYDLYRYDEWHEMLYDSGTMTCACNLTDNRPMNRRLIKLHKGVDNEVKFRVFDTDRKRTRLDHLRVGVVLINQENHELCLKTTGKLMPERGTFRVMINESDLADLAPGFYDFIITGEEWSIPEQPGDVVSTPFFTDTEANMRLVAEVTTQGEKLPVPTVEVHSINPKTGLSDWIVTNETVDSIYARVYHSSPVPASRIKNHKNSSHTFAMTAENFTGLLQVKGSLEHIPPNDPSDYFPLNLTSFKDFVEYGPLDLETGLREPFTGIDPYTFAANVMWLMFVWIPTDENGIPIEENVFPTDWEEPVKRIQVRS